MRVPLKLMHAADTSSVGLPLPTWGEGWGEGVTAIDGSEPPHPPPSPLRGEGAPPSASSPSPVGVLERDHVAARDSHPFGGHRRSAAAHVPGGVGLAKSAFGAQAIHRIDDKVAALGG